MPKGHDPKDLRLIATVIETTFDECEKRGLALSGVTLRLFALVERGERNFEILKSAAINPDLADVRGSDGSGVR